VQGFDLALHYGDGSNVYQYIGSDPLGGSDPAGLMEFSLGGLMGSSAQAAGMYSDYNQEVIQNAGIAYGFIGAAVGAYAMDQLLDGNWASDWNEPDDLYRGSAEWSSGTGSWASEGPQSVASNGQVVAGEYAGRFDKAERTANGLGVYIVKRGEEIIYVGRSRDLARRMKEQEARFGKGVKVVGLSFGEFAGRNKNNYKAVRALEDLLIRELRGENKDLANKINGMSDNDPKKRKAYQRALRAALGNLR
jgi:predicted GIY-YIG superfamily endonuclease